MGPGCWDFTGPRWNDLSTWAPPGPTRRGLWIKPFSCEYRQRLGNRGADVSTENHRCCQDLTSHSDIWCILKRDSASDSNRQMDGLTLQRLYSRTAVFFPLSHNPFCFSSFTPACLCMVLKEVTVTNPNRTPQNKHRSINSLIQSRALPVLTSMVPSNQGWAQGGVTETATKLKKQ